VKKDVKYWGVTRKLLASNGEGKFCYRDINPTREMERSTISTLRPSNRGILTYLHLEHTNIRE